MTFLNIKIKSLLLSSLCFCIFAQSQSQSQSQDGQSLNFDVVIVGGTPAGIMAGISSSREGKSVVLLERTSHIGGLPANGLGATDIKTKGAAGGLFKKFIKKIESYYSDTYGKLSSQHRAAKNGYHFEPSVAEMIFEDMISREKNLVVLKNYQFDALSTNLVISNDRIKSILVSNRDNGNISTITGKQFIDATYEGDLIAAAGEKYAVGRESKMEYGEHLAGKVYKYWEGPIGEGSTFEGDKAIQAFNYRLCLTNNPEKRIPIEKPQGYSRTEYISLIKDVMTGAHGGVKYFEFLKKHPDKAKKILMSDGSKRPKVPGSPVGIDRLVHLTKLPNDKSDANNQELSLLSTDLPEENWFWPEGSWAERDQFAERLKDYTLGLFWFAQNDESLPKWFRDDVKEWGLDNEEYLDNNYFPRQVYVREGRRMLGQYQFKAMDALPESKGKRPPIHSSSITAGHYSIDSHGVRKRERGRVHLDGFISYGTKPFTIPFGVIVPKTVTNLLAPVPVSATHLGFSAIRLEPTWMELGEVAGIAAAQSIESGETVQELDILDLQKKLLDHKLVLIYFNDLNPTDRGFKGIQLMALNGIYNDWSVKPAKNITKDEIKQAEKLFSLDFSELNGKSLSRSEFAEILYKKI